MAQNSFQSWRFLYLFFQTFFSQQQNNQKKLNVHFLGVIYFSAAYLGLMNRYQQKKK